MSETPFWKSKSLDKMSKTEWESLCDGCGKCCCIRMEDEDTAEIYVTNVTCKLLDGTTCLCTDYTHRKKYVPDCVQVTPEKAASLKWMPRTCAYRLLAEGKELPDYHHLITGDRNTIHERGMSVQGAVISETQVEEDDLISHIVQWPGEPEIGSGE